MSHPCLYICYECQLFAFLPLPYFVDESLFACDVGRSAAAAFQFFRLWIFNVRHWNIAFRFNCGWNTFHWFANIFYDFSTGGGVYNTAQIWPLRYKWHGFSTLRHQRLKVVLHFLRVTVKPNTVEWTKIAHVFISNFSRKFRQIPNGFSTFFGNLRDKKIYSHPSCRPYADPLITGGGGYKTNHFSE